jgi:phosphoglycerate kinase
MGQWINVINEFGRFTPVAKKTVATLTAADVAGKRVLVRADFNVPLDDQGNITDDTRIRAALPTIQDLTGKGAKVVCAATLDVPRARWWRVCA